MRSYNFFATVHVDRFPDLALLVGDHLVIFEPYSVGDDSTIEVFIKGEAGITRRLDQSVQRVKHILSSAPVLEWSE